MCQYLLGMSKDQSVQVFNQKANTSGTWCTNMTTNRHKLTNSYGPRFLYARSYAQVLTDCDHKGVTNNTSVASKTKGINLDRSFTSVVNGHCQNSFRDDTCSIFRSKDMVNNRSYASVVGNTASNTTKDNSMTVNTSPPRGGISY